PTVISLTSTSDMGEDVRRLGIELHLLDLLPVSRFVLGLFGLLRLVRRIRPSLIQGWMLHGNLGALIAGALLRIPVIWGVRHSRLLLGREKRSTVVLERALGWFSGVPARIVYNSKEGKRSHENLGYSSKRSLVIPNGFDTTKFRPSAEIRQAARSSLDIPEEAVVIGMIARYHPMKDHINFLQAASVLRKSHPEAIFLLIGRGCEPANADLVSHLDELSLRDIVRLVGRRTDVDRLINAL